MIYASTACLPGKQPLSSRMSLYKKHGIKAIELGAGVTVDENDLAQIIEDNEQILIHNYFPPPTESFVLNLASANNNIRKRSLELVHKAMTLSANLKAAFYSVHAGFITDPVGFGTTSFIFPSPKSSTESRAAFDRFCYSLEQILHWAGQLGVSLLIENNVCSQENKGKLLLQTAEEFMELFSLVNNPHLGILLDTGHMKVSANTFNFDIDSFIQTVAPHVRAVHLHDNDGIYDSHQPVKSESQLFNLLNRSLFQDVVTVVESKFESAEQLKQYVTWLSKELKYERIV